MRETNKARAAFEDYYKMGPGRSLSKLAALYQTYTKPEPPTRSFQWLKRWSSEHKWQERVAQRDAEITRAAMDALKQKATQSGYALFFKRLDSLNVLAERMYDSLMAGDKPQNYLGAVKEFRALLADIAAEMGERPTKLEVRDWRSEVIELLKNGKITPEEVEAELGSGLAAELFESAGISIAAG